MMHLKVMKPTEILINTRFTLKFFCFVDEDEFADAPESFLSMIGGIEEAKT